MAAVHACRHLSLWGTGMAGSLLTLLGFLTVPARSQETRPVTPADIDAAHVEAGRAIYNRRCTQCHGAEGRGNGGDADFLHPRPRDFTRGAYKIRSTPGSQLPRDEDLIRTVSRGLHGTAMPAFETILSEQERRQVVQFIKTFSKKFARLKKPPPQVLIGKRVPSSPESIAKGRQLFQELECWKCHGLEGRADGPSSFELRDDLDFPIRPANFHRPWNLRGGSAPEDIYLRINTGLAGTPMPTFADVLDNEKSWHVVNFVLSLSANKKEPDTHLPMKVESGPLLTEALRITRASVSEDPSLRTVIRAVRINRAVPARPDDPQWDGVEAYRFNLFGQVVREDRPVELGPRRKFTPTMDEITVKAVYNDRDVALQLIWDDPSLTWPRQAAGDVPGLFEDAVAVQFPVYRAVGVKRPHFLMGDRADPVNLWRWGTGTERVAEQNGAGLGTVTASPNHTVTSSTPTVFRQGQYRLVLRRSLATSDPEHDVQFEAGVPTPIAFFVWDGSNGETGTRMSFSYWYTLLLEPQAPTTASVAPTETVLTASASTK